MCYDRYTEKNQPSLADDFLRIHRAITRGLTVAVSRGSDFVKGGFPDRNLQQGFALYLQALTAVVSAHHQGEDEVAFPALQLKLPAVPYERLGTDHQMISTAIDIVKGTLSQLSGADLAAALVEAVDSLKSILVVWKPHIEIEQNAFSVAAIAGVMTPAEQAGISAAFAKSSQEHIGPPYIALPFVLFNLTPADRAPMAAMMPKMLMDLIPGEWQEKWAPMKPFLLD